MIFLGISCLLCVLFISLKQRETELTIVVDADWMLENLYRVDTYTECELGYEVSLIKIEKAKRCSFDDMVAKFMSTPYNITNNYYLKDGVNCQGMVCYLADWCSKMKYPFSVNYTSSHVYIIVEYEGCNYKFDFDLEPSVTKL